MIAVEQQLGIVSQQIIRARIFYDLWWFYKGAETRPQIIDTLNEMPGFFRFDEHAHFVSMVVHCGVIWDKSHISLKSVANRVLDCQHHDGDKDIKQGIASLEAQAKGIRTIRNEAIAHRSATFDYGETFRRAQLTPDQIRGMLDCAQEFANLLRSRMSLAETDLADAPLRDLQRVIHRLGGPDLRPRSLLDEILES